MMLANLNRNYIGLLCNIVEHRREHHSERIEIGAFAKIFNQRFQLNKTPKLVFVFGGSRGRRPRMRIRINGNVCGAYS
jgi:hypothetical protein